MSHPSNPKGLKNRKAQKFTLAMGNWRELPGNS
jgi:hypothetical protein